MAKSTGPSQFHCEDARCPSLSDIAAYQAAAKRWRKPPDCKYTSLCDHIAESARKSTCRLATRHSRIVRVLTGSDIDLIETTRLGVVQNFEVVYEQSWKVLRRWELLGSDIMQRRQLYRLAAIHGLLNDVEAWWDFHEARNITSHTYSPPIALEVAAKSPLV